MNKRDIFENNLAAITTMKEVESRGGFATEEEKSTMIRFQGFGGCSEAFYLNKDKTGAKNRWELEAQALAEALTDEEYQEARESVLNAFFTPKAVVDNVFDFLPRISDKRLEIFEPGCGVGNFLSMMPVNFEFNTYTGLEKDNISARIASAIYKESANITIVNEDFSKDTNKNKYDLIIGNPPFGDSKINGKSIHNFFIDKSINMLKPGGILSFVITHYFLDSLNPETRLNIFKKANLLVADRLDDEAFSHLNTDINTDIVMFQRLTAEEESKRSALIKDSPELAKGDIPDKFVYDDDVNWIKSYSPNKHFAKNSAEKIAPINFGYYNSNSVQFIKNGVLGDAPINFGYYNSNSVRFIKNGVLCDALDRFGKPTIKTFSYENYQKLGLESDDVIKKFKSENYVHKVNFRNNIIKDMIDFASFRKNLGVVIDDSLSAEKSEEGKDGVLVDSFEVFGVGLDASSEYERLKERSYQTTLLSGSFLALKSISVDDEKFKALELESQNSGSNIFKTKIVSTSISGADGFTVGHKHDFYVEPYIPLKKQKGKEVVDTKKLDAVGRYIQLRDTTTTLLDADSNGEPSEDTRVKLNQLYDEYVENFSFLNNKHHKRPFMEDPLVYRVLSLEKDYDKGVSKAVSISSGEEQRNESATKIDLFYKSVVTPLELQDMSNASMEELLDYSLAYNSSCDIDFMVQVSGISAETIADNLISNQSIFFDPENFNYVVKGVYLSGDIRGKIDKLKEFNASNVTINNYGFEIDVRHNFQSLTNVLPEEIKIHDIDPQLGEGWIPADIIVDFAYTELFPNLENTDSISIEFLPENGKWVLGHQGDLGFSDFNTDHKQAIDIFSAVINSKSVIVKKTITNEHGTELKVVNQEATAIAQEKANLIKELFGSFIINNPSYIGRLETTYNECFNRFVSPNYNKVGKLLLPGKVSDDVIELRPTQENAISRIINNKATLLDHTVGLGKTFTMVAAAMELKRIGTSKKPLLVVPNHIVDDFAKAFMSLYPQSDILTPPQGGLSKKNRLSFFERARMLNVDAIIIGHSAFKYLQVSKETQQEVYADIIDNIESAIFKMNKIDGVDKRSITQQIQQKERVEQKLEDLLSNTGDKDYEASTIENIGIDSIFVDEAHMFKNLGFPTSMSRIAGLGSTSGSQMAMDLFLKIQHINKIGGKVVFATGTPISNSMAELYTMQRYLSLDSLNQMGVSHFDAWQSVFATVTSEWELAPTGMDYRLISRFSKFNKVPELMAMYQSFADVVTKKDLEEALKRVGKEILIPVVNGGRPANIVVNKNAHVENYMQEIIKRATNLPADPAVDNMLKVMNDARKAALDFRLIGPLANIDEEEGSKLAEVGENLIDIYRRYNDIKGVQLVFVDLSTPTAKTNQDYESFNAYDDIKSRLLYAGIPDNEIAYIHNATTDQKKADLYAKVRGGSIRILLGSTFKMGAGMNVQDRLVALHHVDAPWRPSDIEQREGRILRQGNIFYQQNPDKFQPHILRYATEETLDSRMWQTIENKASFIEQFRSGGIKGRTMSEINTEAMSSAEMKAAASGNPLVLEEIKLKSDINKLERLKKSELAARASEKNKILNFNRAIESIPKYIKGLKSVIFSLTNNPQKIEGKTESSKDKNETNENKLKKKEKINHDIKVYDSASEFNTYPDYISAANAIKEKIKLSDDNASVDYPLFNYRGVDFDFEMLDVKDKAGFLLQGKSLYVTTTIDINQEIVFAAETINPMGFFTRINHFLRNMDGYLVEQKNDLKQSQSGLDFLNNIGNTSKLFDDKDQEELLLLKNKYDSILTELQNSESQENSKESNYIANIKFIRTSEDSIETLVFDANFGEYAKKAMLTRDENNEYWELCGDKFECLYQAKLRAHHLFNEKYKDVNSTKYDINDIDFKELSNNDGVVFEGEATEELSGSDTFFSDVLEASSANDLLFVDSFQDEKIKKEKPMVKAKKLNAWFG